MNLELLAQLQAASAALDPSFKALRMATGLLNRASKLASEEKLDAIAMQKLLPKLEEASNLLDDEKLAAAVTAFPNQTEKVLPTRPKKN